MDSCGTCYEPLEVVGVDFEGVDIIGCPICHEQEDEYNIDDDMGFYT